MNYFVVKKKVLLAIPTRGIIHFELVQWMIKMIRLSENPDNPWSLEIVMSKGGHQNPNNNSLAMYSVDSRQFDYYLKMDDDLVPDDGLIDRLIEMDKDFIGVAIAIWRESHNPPAFVAVYDFDIKTHKYVQSDLSQKKQGKCDYVGGGCFMMKYDLLKGLVDIARDLDSPIWQYRERVIPDENGVIFEGSDEILCNKLHNLGFEVWYDATYIIPQHTDLLVSSTYHDDGFRLANVSYSNPPKASQK